jgi:hypothetical protein
MKTIEEASLEYAEELGKAIPEDMLSMSCIEVAFEKGVTFAQQWIDINDELPKFGFDCIVKLEDGTKLMGFLNSQSEWEIYFAGGLEEPRARKVAHWRPIDRL